MTLLNSRGYLSSARVSNPPGAFALIQASDFGSIQPALVTIPVSTTGIEYLVIPNNGSQWKTQKAVELVFPDGVPQTPGLNFGGAQCISPVYPGTSQAVTAAAASAVASAFVMNGYLFLCTTSGTTAATFIGFSAFNTTKGGVTIDGTAHWTCQGKAMLVELHFSNSNIAPATPVAPVAQAIELFQL